MSYWANVNGIPIAALDVGIPWYGAWVADLKLLTPDAITKPATITIGDLTLLGFSYRDAAFAGMRTARLVAGYGGWAKPLVKKAYQNTGGINLSLVLGDAAIEAGEKLNLPASIDGTIGNFFARVDQAPAQHTLRELAGALWWIDPLGVTQLLPRLATPITSPFQVIDYEPLSGRFVIATETLGDWMPARTFTSPTVQTSATVSYVRHMIANEDGVHRLEVLAA